MTVDLQLTDQENPLAQTFRVTEPGGSVITSIGVFFHTAPRASDPQHKIFLELRPVGETGFPSSQEFWSRTKVKATAAQIRAVANTSYTTGTEYKFTFRAPLFIPENTEVAFVLYSAAGAGKYKIWGGSVGDFYFGSTKKRIAQQLDAGSMFQSSNGTTWSADQSTDLAFKVYRAKFTNKTSVARIEVSAPSKEMISANAQTNKLVERPADPIVFNASSNVASIIHPGHGFQIGDHVILEDLDQDSATIVNGVRVSSYIGQRTITDVDPFGYTFNMDSVADSSVRAGGMGLLGSRQVNLDDFMLKLPIVHPRQTNSSIVGKFTTTSGFAGGETAYLDTIDVPVRRNSLIRLKDPHVVASEEQENLHLAGAASTYFDVYLSTHNRYVAPWIRMADANLLAASFLVDYQAETTTAGRNTLSTIPFVSEAEPDGGTTASKHITVPFTLAQASTSIRVMVDAARPAGSDFSVWYRTASSSSGSLITDTRWTEFSKSVSSPNKSNYNDIGFVDDYDDQSEYEFNGYDIPSFDTYQIKITFNARKQTQPARIYALRTIATV